MFPRIRLTTAAVLLALCAGTPALALPMGRETPQPVKDALQGNGKVSGVDVVEHLGEKLPLDLTFTADDGRAVRLGDMFKSGRPVALSLVYYRCPQLCNLLLNGQVGVMQKMKLDLGEDYDAVSVSIDPADTPAESQNRRVRHLQAMGKPPTASWRFLTGDETNVRALADALGFKYTYDEASKQFLHPAVMFVISPDGTVSRYLYGVTFEQRDLHLALVEAADGKVGTSLDRIILSCYQYDAASRRYGFYIFGFIRLGGLLALASLSTLLIVLWRRELKVKKGAAA